MTGQLSGSALRTPDEGFRPALFARYRDLSSLRYDLPLVLRESRRGGTAVVSLSGLIDDVVEDLAGKPTRDQIARHGYRLEKQLRTDLETLGSGDFATLWNQAADKVISEGEPGVSESLEYLRSSISPDGILVDAIKDLPFLVSDHIWRKNEAEKEAAFGSKVDKLIHNLRGILNAEAAGSAAGRSPDSLKSSIGNAFEEAFDFDAMSRILSESLPGTELSAERRKRIVRLIDQLENQRFFPGRKSSDEIFDFRFSKCSDAVEAYKLRHEEAVELVKAIAMAELETEGNYRESVHDEIFDRFTMSDLEPNVFSILPDYLICIEERSLDGSEKEYLTESLAAGLPFKIVVRTDDVFKPPRVSEGHLALSLNAHQLVDTAIGLTDVYVQQSSASHLAVTSASILRGFRYEGPALFSIFSGVNEKNPGIPSYLVAAAAVESRVFPLVCYDPDREPGDENVLDTSGNPQFEEDWPLHDLIYETAGLKANSENVRFTILDFMSLDSRFRRHFAIVSETDWSDWMIPAADAIEAELKEPPDVLPYINLVDSQDQLYRAIVDHRTLGEARRCRDMWRSLRLRGSRRVQDSEKQAEAGKERSASAVTSGSDDSVVTPTRVVASEPLGEAKNGDDPYIETPRCTSCNECTQINGRMFAYDENQQAYIADPDAGTFRQLVEAAEGCQVAIIHPGKPRNPKEPGLEDLIKRAAEFN